MEEAVTKRTVELQSAYVTSLCGRFLFISNSEFLNLPVTKQTKIVLILPFKFSSIYDQVNIRLTLPINIKHFQRTWLNLGEVIVSNLAKLIHTVTKTRLQMFFLANYRFSHILIFPFWCKHAEKVQELLMHPFLGSSQPTCVLISDDGPVG